MPGCTIFRPYRAVDNGVGDNNRRKKKIGWGGVGLPRAAERLTLRRCSLRLAVLADLHPVAVEKAPSTRRVRGVTFGHRHAPGRFMDIIQINSKSGLEGSNRNFAYAGSKFGSIGLTQSFALELVEHNIKVNASGVGTSAGDRNGSRWYEIGSLTATPTLIQSGTLFDSAATTPFGYWIPSVMMSGQGHVALAASRASTAAASSIRPRPASQRGLCGRKLSSTRNTTTGRISDANIHLQQTSTGVDFTMRKETNGAITLPITIAS